MPRLDFLTVDVFTSTGFQGNPLLVVPDARGLSENLMRSIVSEFNYSEAVFVLPPDNPSNDARIRIYTPADEIPFAGHPNVGVACALHKLGTVFGRRLGEVMKLEQRGGLVLASVFQDEDLTIGARIQVPQPMHVGQLINVGEIAACASLEEADVVLSNHSPLVVSIGLPCVLAELKDLATLAAAYPNSRAFSQSAEVLRDRVASLYLYVRASEPGVSFYARMFDPLSNIPEDPVTGSAAAALVAFDAFGDPRRTLRVRNIVKQGAPGGRKGTVEVIVQKTDGLVTNVLMVGRCVSMMEGKITI